MAFLESWRAIAEGCGDKTRGALFHCLFFGADRG